MHEKISNREKFAHIRVIKNVLYNKTRYDHNRKHKKAQNLT